MSFRKKKFECIFRYLILLFSLCYFNRSLYDQPCARFQIRGNFYPRDTEAKTYRDVKDSWANLCIRIFQLQDVCELCTLCVSQLVYKFFEVGSVYCRLSQCFSDFGPWPVSHKIVVLVVITILKNEMEKWKRVGSIQVSH